jgi:hypothetical protein
MDSSPTPGRLDGPGLLRLARGHPRRSSFATKVVLGYKAPTWLTFDLLAVLLIFDFLAYRFGIDSRLGFGDNPESPGTSRRAL